MARKKKTEEQAPAVKVDAPKKKTKKLENVDSGGWPKINQGSHLTVKTFEDGRTELIWDDEALARDVRNAIASVEGK
jgi:hypothetical protein